MDTLANCRCLDVRLQPQFKMLRGICHSSNLECRRKTGMTSPWPVLKIEYSTSVPTPVPWHCHFNVPRCHGRRGYSYRVECWDSNLRSELMRGDCHLNVPRCSVARRDNPAVTVDGCWDSDPGSDCQ
ncbi:hypothetical protein AVEN_46041-1 [Araneus ventricosus]|uniref:Uncharacterized protein n=1 Tax=Araneus ventricosus TaxID=182803 RepID=A0A4Y2UVD3_ARAVE|nr:hypothetical protein AVEN_46041-1 [Araneus ventricosus]